MRLPALQINNAAISSDSPLQWFRRGEADQVEQNKRNLLKQVGGLAASGNMEGAANAALQGGDVKTGIGLRDHTFNRKTTLENMSRDKRIKAFNMIHKGVEQANTPESYNALVKVVSDTFGPEAVAGYETWDKRPSALTAMQRATLALREQEAEEASQLRSLKIQQAQRALATGNLGETHKIGDQLVRIAPDGTKEVLHTAPKSVDPVEQKIMDMLSDSPQSASSTQTPMTSATGATDFSGASTPIAPSQGATAPPLDPVGAPARRSPLADMDDTQKLKFLMTYKGKGKAAGLLTPGGVDYSGRYKDAKQKADVESGLRKEFQNLSKDYFKVRDAYGRVVASAKDPSAAGDLALIFNYMKILDPGSTVREGEFATAQNSGSVPSRVLAMYNSIRSGERLVPKIREDFLSRSKALYGAQNDQFLKINDQYRVIAENLGLSVGNVILDYGRPKQDAPDLTPQQNSRVEKVKSLIDAGRLDRGRAEALLEKHGIPASALGAQ